MVKKIHYVWLGGKNLPQPVISCIRSWEKYCPDWEIIRWDENNFDVNKYKWVREAIECKKFAFAADFIRLKVLSEFGGLYMDTDVSLSRNISPIINAGFVTGFENNRYGTIALEQSVTEDGFYKKDGKICTWFNLQAGFMYAEPKHPFILQCINVLYDNGNKTFLNIDGTTNQFVIDLSLMLQLKQHGIKYRDKTQYLPELDIRIYNSNIIASKKSRNKDSYAIHWYDQSWKTNAGLKQWIKRMIKKYFYLFYRKI